MRTPNDRKRPNTKGSAETRERKRNLNYIWVSKKIHAIDYPVVAPDGSLTLVKKFVAEQKGKTFNVGKNKKKHERKKNSLRYTQGP
jgi:hypothetical protein